MTIENPEDEGTEIQDPIISLNVVKIDMLTELITRDRQPWIRLIEKKSLQLDGE